MSQQTMVERVARAICASLSDKMNGWDTLGGDEREDFLAAARVAIEAMREPTTKMSDAGDEASASLAISRDSSGNYVWQAMIDAALKEA